MNPPTHSPGNAPTGGILLVEEYIALRVAITAALQKFAPLHDLLVAHTIAEAEEIAAVMRPELFLLDLDPPPRSGGVAFFNKLKTQYPDARALVIAAGTSRELRIERGTAGAIQFIEKPFDLAEFGAAVQALLGPWALPHTTHFRGTLRDLHLVDILQLTCLALSSTVVRLETADGKSGAIYFRRGQICHAVTGTLTGASALEEMANWPDAHLSETDLPGDIPTTINAAWPVLLLPIVRQLAEGNRKKLLGAAPPPPSGVAKIGKKILIIDDTEMLLIFAEDSLVTADQTLQITTASTGAKGLQLAASTQPDLILLDYSLTDMTGDKVCHALLENATTARIPVLMMSGHVSEMAQTAHAYGNVVTSLAKPFLSGALISEVERVLAAGQLPVAPRAPSISKAAASPSAPASAVESRATPGPNGHGAGDSVASPPAGAEESPTPPISELPKSTAVKASEKPRAPAVQPPSIAQRPTTTLVRPTEVNMTLALEVVSMELTRSFRIEAVRLQSSNPIVSVQMSDRAELIAVPPENGFRLGAIRLLDDGRIDTMRLVPTHQPPQLPAAKSFFAIGGMRLARTNSDQNLQFTAPANEAMRVLLTAQCELLAVELSVAFEVVAIMLRTRGEMVAVHNGLGSDGAPFVLAGVDLNPEAELRVLLVRAVN